MELITRAVTLSLYPLSGPTKAEMYKLLHRSWDLVQRAGNEAMRQYLIGDAARLVVGKSGKQTLDKIPGEVSNAAYHAARAVAPELPSGSVADICQRVRGKYMADRWAVRVAGRQSVPTFARPLPLSIRTQDWSLGKVTDEAGREHYAATFAVLGLRGKDRPTVGLCVRTKRDEAILKQILSGEWERRTLEILPAGWKRDGVVKVKVVYRRPKPEPEPSSGERVLVVRTGSPSLLTAETNGRGFSWNARSLRGKLIAYGKRRQDRAVDRKHERRAPAARRRAQNADGAADAGKNRDRVTTELQWIASQVAGYAKRNGYGAVTLDTTDRSWLPQFPWYKLEQCVATACQNAGLAFATVRGKAGAGQPGRNETRADLELEMSEGRGSV